MAADDERLARALHELRRRDGRTQEEAAAAARVSIRMFRRLESGDAAAVPIGVARRIFDAYDARVRVSVWWRGAELDRILDERHAAIVERVVAILERRGWASAVEVTFSEFGERGSIDVLGFHRASRSALVIEVKTALGSLEETNRVFDIKVRLAPGIVAQRFGERPVSVSRVLVVPGNATLRRVVDRHSRTLSTIYPLRSREVRAWLQRPHGAISGLWFLSFRTILSDE